MTQAPPGGDTGREKGTESLPEARPNGRGRPAGAGRRVSLYSSPTSPWLADNPETPLTLQDGSSATYELLKPFHQLKTQSKAMQRKRREKSNTAQQLPVKRSL